MDGTSHLHNVCFHDSGSYIISNAIFPSYFQKDEEAVIESHAMLDLTVFTKIAAALGTAFPAGAADNAGLFPKPGRRTHH